MPSYRAAPDVAEMAAKLIEAYHSPLAEAPILYIFRDEAGKSKGRLVLGKARLVTGLHAFLVALAAGDADAQYSESDESFFVMEIAEDWWAPVSHGKREALVDHELCHFDATEDKLRIRGHDLEEFAAVVERHGLWDESVKLFAAACGSGDVC